jgi:hypothetical protein
MDFRLETQYRAGGLASLSDIWGDFIIYRRLQPADPRLPSLEDLRPILGLREKTLPRKTDPHYGRFVAELLRRARRLDLPGQSIERLVYIGDTQMNDGTAFLHICAAGRWPGWAFIGQEEMTRPPRVQVLGRLYLANRWSSLFDFIEQLEKDQGFGLDEATAVVVDMDKTAIGAKGRNDRVIDRVRLESIRRTLADCLGPGFDNRAFEAAYAELKQPAYHSFTADNQDYLAYICLMLGAGLCGLEELAGQVRSGAMRAFDDFIFRMEKLRPDLARRGLGPLHDEVCRCFREGDPTPFKKFRSNEYLATAACFGGFPDGPIEQTLDERIVITQEVQEAAARLSQKGALIFGLSDKPDEASVPQPVQAAAGMRALHRLETLVVGACHVL